MIVRFAISNFLSFDYSEKPKDCINMKPSRIKQKGDHVVDGYNLLKSMVMFGGNGAGKSSVIKALRFLKRVVTTGWVPEPSDGYYCKNRKENSTKPIRMEIEIINPRSDNDVSLEMDYLFLGMSKWDRDKLQDDDPVPWEHYKYSIELGYLGNDIPYNINCESLCRMYYDRELDMCSRSNTGNTDKYYRQKKEYNELYSVKVKLSKELKDCKEQLEKVSADYYEANKARAVLLKRRNETVHLTGLNGQQPDLESQDNFRRQLKELEKEIVDLEKVINDSNKDSEKLSKKVSELEESIMINDAKMSKITKNDVSSNKPFIYRIRNEKNVDMENWRNYKIASAIYDWFLNTLVLVDVKGTVMPINGFDDLGKINSLLPYFDAHIKGLTFAPVDSQKEIDDIYYETKYGNGKDITELLEFTKSNIGRQSIISHIITTRNNIYQLNYNESRLTINRLMTIHHDGTVHQLIEESDGTHRLIELISVLIKTDGEKVYVIDELDRRLHTLITKNFIDMYYKLGLDNTQLIITTHETRLATTEMFRMDEINLVGHDENFCTVVKRANEVVKDRDKRLDEMYLNNLLGGTPQINY